MIPPIKHILNETGVSEIFKLIVPEGTYLGTYIINRPEGWNKVDSIVDINEEFFNVENFILGESEKIKFSEFTNPTGYNIIKNIYRELGGDGRIIFKWIAIKEGVEYDLLSENFEINLNKYSEIFDKTKMAIEVEVVKNEAQNKLFTREDTTINLFDIKDLDDNDIVPIETFQIGYKKGSKILSNFYFYDISQLKTDFPTSYKQDQFFSFKRADDYEFGDNTNEFAGFFNLPIFSRVDQGPFVGTSVTYTNIEAQISNLSFMVERQDGQFPLVRLVALIRNGTNVLEEIELKRSVENPVTGKVLGLLKIENDKYKIGNLKPGQNLTFLVKTIDGVDFGMWPNQDDTSIQITTNVESPLIKTQAIRIKDAINHVVKNYTSGEISILSNILSLGGAFYDTSISSGMFLRGLPPDYLLQKIKTSIKSILHDGVSKLLALGYDISYSNIIVEGIEYFFKDIKIYDLAQKIYIQEGFRIENDKELAFNNLLFGSKKYSTNVKFDIKNFNTSAEISTPIKSNKNKFDRQTEMIIDEYKIQELINDKSTSTNDNDDDLVLIDMVNAINVSDSGVFEDCSHITDAGKLMLICQITPFDSTLMQVGDTIEITEGLNIGAWLIISIDGSRMVLDKTSGIQEGTIDTPISYNVASLTKNRTNEGFTEINGSIFNPETCTNIRHNPKYQMARWFPFFGSGLRKKLNTELLKVTNYKNNSDAQMSIVAPDMANELQGLVVVGGNEEIGRMRDYKQTFFNGEIIEITYTQITFEEFLTIYNYWKFGEGDDRMKSRGYITCNTPFGIYDIYPFGTGAFSHNKAKNQLSIKGKIKGKSVDNPTLLSVVQTNKNTVTVTWDYNIEYVNPVTKIQASLDGINWTTINTVNNVKTATFSSDLFNDIMTGTTVYFKVLVSTADYSNKSSNTLNVVWQFNNWVLREISRTENINCGFSYLTLEIEGTVNLEFGWDFYSSPGGGAANAMNTLDSTNIVSFTSPYGGDYSELKTTTMSLSNETKQISIQVNNSNKTELGKILNCTSGNATAFVTAYLEISIKDVATTEVITKTISADTTKKYILRPDIPIEGGG